MISKDRASFGSVVMLYAPVIAAVLVWSLTLPPGILMGDDLRLVVYAQHGGWGGSLLKDLTPLPQGIFRPVLGLVMHLLISTFGNYFDGYRAVNIAVDVVNACLVAALAYALSARKLLVGIACGIAFAVSLFSYYHLAQVFGIMESLTLTMTLLIFADVRRAYASGSEGPLLRSVIWFALAVGIEERAFAVFPFLLVAISLAPFWTATDTRRRNVAMLVACAVPVIWYAARLFFATGPLVVVNGHRFAFDTAAFIGFLGDGIATLFGFYVGPPYLAGADFFAVGIAGYLIAFAIGLALALPLLAGLRMAMQDDRPDNWRNTALFAAYVIPELVSASIGIRQEYRWLFNAYLGILLAFAAYWGSATVFAQHWAARLSILLAAGVIAAAIVYRPFAGNIYLFQGQRVTQALLDADEKSGATSMLLIDGGDQSIYNWDIDQGSLFALFGHPDVRVYDYADRADPKLAQAMLARRFPQNTDVELWLGGAFKHVDFPLFSALVIAAHRTPLYAFTDHYSSGAINSTVKVPSPNGRGAFLIDWPAPIEGTFHSLTLISGFSYTYPSTTVPKHVALDVWVADPYAIGSGARAIVSVIDRRGVQTTLVRTDLFPAGPDGPHWQYLSVDLAKFAGQPVSVVFRAEQRTGDATAAWAAFGAPRIVVQP